jgi:DNA-binding MarR family transcriptional regulator
MSHSLQAELHQRRAFRSREEEAYLSLLRTADRLQRQASDLFRDYDLTHTQYNALRILRGAGPDGLLTGEVGARLVTQDPDIGRLLDRLRQRGWVERLREPGDRRCVRAVLSEAGRALVDALDAPVEALLHAQFADLPRAALDTLIDLLGDLRAAGDAPPLVHASAP